MEHQKYKKKNLKQPQNLLKNFQNLSRKIRINFPIFEKKLKEIHSLKTNSPKEKKIFQKSNEKHIKI